MHLLVSLIFATHRATCKAIKTAADFFIRIRDYKGVCNVRQCVFYFRDWEKYQKTLVTAEQLWYEHKLNSPATFREWPFFYKIYFCKKAVLLQLYIYISIKKNSFLTVPFFYTTYIYIYICPDLQKHGYRNLSYIPSHWVL